MKRLALSALFSIAWLAGCSVNPYDLGGGGGTGSDGGTQGDGQGGDANPNDPDAMLPDGAPPDACVPSQEICNDLDEDCDGVADNGFNKQQDPANCGTCGHKCSYTNAFGVCTGGQCSRGACKPGFHDYDSNPDDCEYFCIETGGGVEVCDNVDNDCDGTIDNGFNTQTDENNCGTCGNVCNVLHATPICDTGTCQVDTCNAGFVDLDGSPANGCEYQCSPTNGGAEKCDGVDNDCDGAVDDGNPGGGASCGTDTGECTAGTTQCSFGVLFCVGSVGTVNGQPEQCNGKDDDCDGPTDEDWNFQTDVNHCGGCSPCVLAHATPTCTTGTCQVGSCTFGYVNLNNMPGDGCEYACINTGVEKCDQTDNNCNGAVDEGFNTQSDPNNCGSCGNVCSFTNAAALCTTGGCVMGACAANFYDINMNPTDGCEYGCIKTNGGVEKCDSLDNNCDGLIDNAIPGIGASCGTNTGECTAGVTSCVAGQITCNDVGPTTESCNNKDDDCNGVNDNGFDKLNDPRYCNSCAGCSLPHAVAGCSGGMCTVAGCLQGYVNADGMASNGCELMCTPSGAEVCDGNDNDCDGLTDAADPSLQQPANFCKTAGECAGTLPTCVGGAWGCNYLDPDVEKVNGQLVLEETRCDMKDNDCDGGVDEPYPLENSACAEDGTFGTTRKLGICRGTGTLKCNGMQNGLFCNVTVNGATPVSESCDNKDNDCDGHVDEPYDSNGFNGVRDAVVGPLTINAKSVVMYKYEASRPDANGTSMGIVTSRACSVADRIPWAGPDLAGAQAACAAAGMRLCKVNRTGGVITSDEWGTFCQAGVTNRTFPYGNTYQAQTCNGSDYDPVPGGVNEDQSIKTGTVLTQCVSVDGAFDLSGNLKEWTDDARVAGAQTVYTLRGGSFDNHANGMTCDFDLTVVPSSYVFANTGFRCCSNACPAGQSECSNTCKNLSTDVNNCGACGRACGGGQGCFNGYCCPAGTMLCPGTDQCKASCP